MSLLFFFVLMKALWSYTPELGDPTKVKEGISKDESEGKVEHSTKHGTENGQFSNQSPSNTDKGARSNEPSMTRDSAPAQGDATNVRSAEKKSSNTCVLV